MKTKLSVVIPCYNEERNLKRGVLEEVDSFLRNQLYQSEVIISDDGSTDESRKIIEEFIKAHPRFRLLKNLHAGKPYAVRAGAMEAKGEIALFTDMDQSAPISEINKLLPYFNRGYQVVIGSRGKERKRFPYYRKIISWGFRFARRLVLLRQIVDTQCGFKAFKTEVGRKIFDKMQIFQKKKGAVGWKVGAWDVEFIFVAEKLGYKIKEVQVVWEDKDIAAGKERDFLKESKEMLFEVMRVKIDGWRGKYD